MARENEKVNTQGIRDLNRTFIAFRRAEASSLGWPPDKNATPGTAAGTVCKRQFTVTSATSSTDSCLGQAKPGSSFLADSSWEYSVTRKWVLALDVTYRHNWNTQVTGYNASPSSAQNPSSVLLNSGSSEVFAFAPAIEYSWKSNLGVLVGTRVIPPSHNTNSTVTPAIAINYVH